MQTQHQTASARNKQNHSLRVAKASYVQSCVECRPRLLDGFMNLGLKAHIFCCRIVILSRLPGETLSPPKRQSCSRESRNWNRKACDRVCPSRGRGITHFVIQPFHLAGKKGPENSRAWGAFRQGHSPHSRECKKRFLCCRPSAQNELTANALEGRVLFVGIQAHTNPIPGKLLSKYRS